jgi:arylsulfatase A-like enzyme
MNKRLTITLSVLFGLLLLFTVNLSKANASDSMPNIFLIVCDDCGYGDVTPSLAPSLNNLANESARFTDGYAYSLCSPTRAALYTGRYAERSKVYTAYAWNSTDGMPASEVTIAEQLKAVGYHTGLIGKWHLGDGSDRHPLDQGYDEFFGGLSGAINPFTHRKNNAAGNFNGDLDWFRNRTPQPADNRYDVVAETEEAISFIQSNAHQPWFLTLAYHAIHEPRLGHNGQKDYNGMLKSMDTGIGRVLNTLDETGQANNTIVWFLSDNGGYPNPRNGGLKGAKGSLWEGGIRVRTYVRWPGQIQPGYRHGVENVIDFMPTMLDIVGVPSTHALDGKSLKVSLLNNTGTPYAKHFWSQNINNPITAMRDNQWKLVLIPGQTPYLFNLTNDPNEKTNVANANQANRDRVQSMKQMITTWRNDVKR